MDLKKLNSKIEAMGFKGIFVIKLERKLVLITEEQHPRWLIADDGVNSWTNMKPFCDVLGEDWLMDDILCEKLDSIVQLMDEVILGHPVDEEHKSKFADLWES